VRTLGAIGVVEVDGDFEMMKKLRREFVEAGVFLRPFANCVYVMPALNIKKADLKKITDAIFKILSR